MFRFFVENKIDDNHFEVSSDTMHHMKVARVLKESFICIFEGIFYVCELDGDSAKIIDTLDENHEFETEVVIAAALINIKRFEWLIQKAAELGATKIIPMLTERVVTKLGSKIDKKIDRWNIIAKNASEQSFRNVPLIVATPMKLDQVLETKIKNKYIAHEKAEIKAQSKYPSDSIFLVGPEGGFTDLEVKKANSKNFKSISLGKRILRAETAPLYILSKIME